MNGNARKIVILLVLAIAFLELGVSNRLGSIWQLAFHGSLGDEKAAPEAKDTGNSTNSSTVTSSNSASQAPQHTQLF